MKSVYKRYISILVLIALVFNLFGFGTTSLVAANEDTYVETFDNLNLSGNSYTSGSFVGNNGVTWDYVASRNEVDYPIDGKGLMLGGGPSAHGSTITSSAIDGGISSISVQYRKAFTGAASRQIEILINGQSQSISPVFGNSSGADDTVHTLSVDHIDISGPFSIEIRNASSGSGTAQIVIDNITWTSFSADPNKVARVTASPAPGEVEAGTYVQLSTSTVSADVYYTLDGREPTTASFYYTDPIEITEDTTIKAFAVQDGLDNSDISTFTYTIKQPQTVSTIADARAQGAGTEALIEGTVTHVVSTSSTATNYFVQDETAGIVVRAAGFSLTPQPQPGDKISANGNLADYRGMLQLELSSANNASIVEPGVGVPETKKIESTALNTNGDNVVGQLVEIHDVTVTEVISETASTYEAIDSEGNFVIRSTNKYVEVGKTYAVLIGVVDHFDGTYQLNPRTPADVIEDVFLVVANPAPGGVVTGTQVTLNSPSGGEIYYTTDGTEPTQASTPYTIPIIIFGNTMIKAIVVDGEQVSNVFTFNYTALKPLDSLRIHDIQGAAHRSPYEGQSVSNVEGIVTRVNGINGFNMQDPEPDGDNKTSEGIYVYRSNGHGGVQVGDLVTVTGSVTEYRERGYDDANDLTTTQIVASTINKISSGNELPAPVVIGVDRTPPSRIIGPEGMDIFDPELNALDFYESLEGMLVQLDDAQIIGPYHYEIPVIFELSAEREAEKIFTPAGGLKITEDDFNPEKMLISTNKTRVKTGDSFDGSIVGIMGYDFSNYKVIPTQPLPNVIDGGLQQAITSIEPSEDRLTIATYNIENFSASTPAAKTDRIAQSIVENLKAPDIIGLVEVQDNDGDTNSGNTDASQSYQKLIEAIEAAGGPTYEFSDIAPANNQDGGAPGANIRVGYLYNPERVSLVEKPIGNATTAVEYNQDGLSLNPGRIDPTNPAFTSSRKPLAAEFEFQGEKVIVINNHFNSKRGDDALFGAVQPPVLGSEIQRLQIAGVVHNFIDEIKQVDPQANVVVVGDLNDFEFSAPLQRLKGNLLTNLVEKLPIEERYTYIYQGNSQVLDHILVSNHLADHTEIDIVRLNADFMEEDGRASDHDPLLAQIDVHAGVPAPIYEVEIDPTVDNKVEHGEVTIQIPANAANGRQSVP